MSPNLVSRVQGQSAANSRSANSDHLSPAVSIDQSLLPVWKCPSDVEYADEHSAAGKANSEESDDLRPAAREALCLRVSFRKAIRSGPKEAAGPDSAKGHDDEKVSKAPDLERPIPTMGDACNEGDHAGTEHADAEVPPELTHAEVSRALQPIVHSARG
jgi:hypothetical protein